MDPNKIFPHQYCKNNTSHQLSLRDICLKFSAVKVLGMYKSEAENKIISTNKRFYLVIFILIVYDTCGNINNTSLVFNFFLPMRSKAIKLLLHNPPN